MTNFDIYFPEINYSFPMIYVKGTGDTTYLFGDGKNVWEWCQDYYQKEVNKIPKDGTPYLGEGSERVLRGGCHHNWAIHCTVSKRYGIIPEAKDECIGFRIAASIKTSSK